MGRQSRLKQLRREQGQPGPGAKTPQGTGAGLGWLIGLILLLGVVIAAGVWVFQANRAKFFSAGLLASAVSVREELHRRQARFTLEQSQQLEALLIETQAIAGAKNLDPRAVGQLNFVLTVTREIVEQGNPTPEEIGKLIRQVLQVKAYLARQARPTPALP